MLRSQLEAGRQLYNAVLGETLSRLGKKSLQEELAHQVLSLGLRLR